MKARVIIEFNIKDSKRVPAGKILNEITPLNDDVVDGFCLTTHINGFDNTNRFFLSNGRIIKKELI